MAARVEAPTRGASSSGSRRCRSGSGSTSEDADVLMHAAAAQLDPSLGKLHTKLSGTAFHPWLDVGLAVQVQHDGVAERLRARARFRAGRRRYCAIG